MQRPLASDLFSWPDDTPHLLGGRCSACSAVAFPKPSRCPRCGKAAIETLPLPRRGKLVAWTTQGFPPIVPYAGDATGASFKPFGVGLVQLDDLVRVESRLTESNPEKLDFGMDVELEVVPFYVDAEGHEILTFAFAPVAAAQRSKGEG